MITNKDVSPWEGGRIPSRDPAGFAADLRAAVATALISLPALIACGIVAYAPLGHDFSGAGIRAAVLATLLGGLVTVLGSPTPGFMSSPRLGSSLLLGTILIHYRGLLTLEGVPAGDAIDLLLLLAPLTVLLAGLIQVLAGSLRLGNLFKFIPYPVVAGIQNGVALLLIVRQTPVLLGGDPTTPWVGIRAPIAAIGLLALLLFWKGERFIPRPALIVATFAGGSLLFVGLRAVGFEAPPGAVLEAIRPQWPELGGMAALPVLLGGRFPEELLPSILMSAFSLAALASIYSLMDMVSWLNRSSDAPLYNQELSSQGLGNILSGAAGGIMAEGNHVRSAYQQDIGVTSPRARFLGVIMPALLVLGFGSFFDRIPKAVIAGITIVIAARLFDPWSFRLARKVFRRDLANRTEMLVNLAVILLVCLAVLWVGIMPAMALGLVLSVFIFLFQVSRSVIRRTMDGSRIRSRRLRPPADLELLERHGGAILIMELEGTIFFASADEVAREADRQMAAGIRHVILDMRRVTHLDGTGARILFQIQQRAQARGVTLLFSHIHDGDYLHRVFTDMDLFDAIGRKYVFTDTSSALEAAEDRLLAELTGREVADSHDETSGDVIFGYLTAEERNTLLEKMQPVSFAAGDTVVRERGPADAVYFILSGSVDVVIDVPRANRTRIINTLHPGSVFGEMSLIDGLPRSASVVTREPTGCLVLSREAFEEISAGHPLISQKLLRYFARLLSARLRSASDIIAELES